MVFTSSAVIQNVFFFFIFIFYKEIICMRNAKRLNQFERH